MRGLNFQEFVKIVLEEERKNKDLEYKAMNEHWSPMNAHCFFCNINYTVISKMETYDEDRNKFLKLAGIDEEITEERMHVHAGNSIQGVTTSLFKEISLEDREGLIKLYKYEMDMFDYNPDIY